MPRLIVNADDYGISTGVNLGIQQCFTSGALTSATLMAAAPHAPQAAQFARSNPQLGLGCHLVLLNGTPASPPDRVSSLLQPGTEHFYPTLPAFLRALYSGTILPAHIHTEVLAQLHLLSSLGLQPTHVDTHKHSHMFPAVLSPVLAAASAFGVRTIRNPFEPHWSLHLTPGAALLRKVEVSLLRRLHRHRFLASVRQHGFLTTDGALGVAATGSLNHAAIHSLLRNLPEGTWELVCHPGYVDDALVHSGTRLLASRQVELAALAQLPQLLTAATQLVHFGGLTA